MTFVGKAGAEYWRYPASTPLQRLFARIHGSFADAVAGQPPTSPARLKAALFAAAFRMLCGASPVPTIAHLNRLTRFTRHAETLSSRSWKPIIPAELFGSLGSAGNLGPGGVGDNGGGKRAGLPRRPWAHNNERAGDPGMRKWGD